MIVSFNPQPLLFVIFQTTLTGIRMFKNYLKVAWRNLVRNKAFSAINILGLSLGLMCSMLIMLWIQDERSVDAFHKNGNRLFQVYERSKYSDGKVDAGYTTQGLLAEELKKVIPEIEYTSSTDYAAAPGTQSTFEANNKVIKNFGKFAGEDFFRMFSFPLLQGTAAMALNTPGCIALSRKMADEFFGSATNAIGQTIRYENKEDLKVTAVFENMPANSTQQVDFLRSWTDYVKQNEWVHNWGNTGPETFIMLRAGVNETAVEAKIKDFVYRYMDKSQGTFTELALQSYPSKYLHSNFKNGQIDGGRIEYVNLFTIVALFIMLIACINFMNLATARSSQRAKEVGLRKVIGAGRWSLIGQFIGEAMLLTFLSVVIALFASWLVLPSFNSLTGKQLTLPVSEPVFWMALAGLLSVTGLIAGSYPAFFLSSLKPVRVLKGTLKFSYSATFFRQALVVFQFALSIILIIGMIVIYRQMNFIQNKNLGYDRENLIYIPIEGELINKYATFKDEAAKLPSILDVSKMRNSPTIIEHHTGSISWPGKDPNSEVPFADGVVGYDFVKTMKLQLAAGRDFSKQYADSASYILNETAVNKIGYKDPIGKVIIWGNRRGTIIGVLKDFHFSSMHSAIDPLIIRLDENWPWGTILVRTSAGKTKDALAGLQTICKSLNPKFPFTYQFSDLEFAKLYQSEQVVSKLSDYFAVLAILISCLGLFGLATFVAAQRTKEIGVRKVLGASVGNIVTMFSGNFLKLVGIAMLVAFPAAWWAMNKWLQNYTYKIDIGWPVFAVAGIATVAIALLTVSYQSIKAAMANPVKSLRTE
jgi:ABC-type antimicrobial peptide transport system permease subunit